jgi:hypothetical protein
MGEDARFTMRPPRCQRRPTRRYAETPALGGPAAINDMSLAGRETGFIRG